MSQYGHSYPQLDWQQVQSRIPPLDTFFSICICFVRCLDASAPGCKSSWTPCPAARACCVTCLLHSFWPRHVVTRNYKPCNITTSWFKAWNVKSAVTPIKVAISPIKRSKGFAQEIWPSKLQRLKDLQNQLAELHEIQKKQQRKPFPPELVPPADYSLRGWTWI